MNDYKELLKTLRSLCSVKDYEQCEYNLEAADAIEQLMNDYEILAKMYAKVNEDLCAKTKECDAAVEEISLYHYCGACKHSDVSEEKEPCLSCSNCWSEREKCNWEWRGVEHE